MKAGADGSYNFGLEGEKDYQLRAEKPDYTEKTKQFGATRQEEGDLKFDLYLADKGSYSLYALIRDDKTKEVLQAVQITLTDKEKGQVVLEEITGPSGNFLYMLQDKKQQTKGPFSAKDGKERLSE